MWNFNLFPKEIMLEILSRVPTEFILECKLVSKSWKKLIQHPSFSLIHLNHLNNLDRPGKFSFIFDKCGLFDKCGHNEEHFIYSEYDESLNRFTRTTRIKLRPPFKKCYILGSCNGLVCFNAYIDDYLQPAYVCNPITREFILLPTVEYTRFLGGFGYTPSTNEYKVVRICRNMGDPNFGIIQVYTLGSGLGWRNGRKMADDVTSFGYPGAFVNGDIHWVSRHGTIVAFDLVHEEFRELTSPPPQPCLKGAIPRLDVVGDFLCASYPHFDGSDVWVFKKNGRNHDVVWSTELSNVVIPIAFTRSGGLLCQDHLDNNVYQYASKASSSRMLVDSCNYFARQVPHRNTLVSLKELGEEDTKLMGSGEIARSSWETESSGHEPTEQTEEKDL